MISGTTCLSQSAACDFVNFPCPSPPSENRAKITATFFAANSAGILIFQRKEDNQFIISKIESRQDFFGKATTMQSNPNCAPKKFRPQTKKIYTAVKTLFHRSIKHAQLPSTLQKSMENTSRQYAKC